MKPIKFSVKLEGAGKWGRVACFTPPFDVFATFGTTGRVPVRGTINGFPYRSSLCQMGGPHFLVVNKQLCAGAKCGVGDTVKIVLERDTEKRVVLVPTFLRKIIAADKSAKARWDKLSYTHQKEYVKWIGDAKQEVTREKRMAKMMDVLRHGKEHPL